MEYRFVLLKDLPEHKAGTVFKCFGIVKKEERKGRHWIRTDYYRIGTPDRQRAGSYVISYEKVGGLYDSPEWFRKEIDQDRIIDLRCPKCDSTRGFLFYTAFFNQNKSREGFSRDGCVESAFGFECATCGHKRILSGSHAAIQRLHETMTEDQAP